VLGTRSPGSPKWCAGLCSFFTCLVSGHYVSGYRVARWTGGLSWTARERLAAGYVRPTLMEPGTDPCSLFGRDFPEKPLHTFPGSDLRMAATGLTSTDAAPRSLLLRTAVKIARSRLRASGAKILLELLADLQRKRRTVLVDDARSRGDGDAREIVGLWQQIAHP
jgi:hypothetical protein